MEIRRYKPGEELDIWSVFYGSMRFVCSRDYTPEQIARWAPNYKDMDEWSERLAKKNPFVAIIGSTIVGFAELEPEWIRAYCATGDPMDKAGAYAVQGGAGQYIKHIDGSYSGVMGLPLFETAQLLEQAGYRL